MFCYRQALAEFEMYRQRMEDSQLCTEAQHTQRVVSMSREVRLYSHTHTHTHKYIITWPVKKLCSAVFVLGGWRCIVIPRLSLMQIKRDIVNYTQVVYLSSMSCAVLCLPVLQW